MTGKLRDVSGFDAKDIRRGMPRFQAENFAANRELLYGFSALAEEGGCTPAQLALAWLLAKSANIVPIPGTTSVEHLAENVGAASVTLAPAMLDKLDAAINRHTVTGPRYNAATQAEIDTEDFAA